MKILVDMDEVICDFLGELCTRYNSLLGTELHPAQLVQYDLTPFVGEVGKRIFLSPGFFTELKPFPNAINTLRNLCGGGHHVVVATDAKGDNNVAADKAAWIARYLPFLPAHDFVVTSRKYLIEADLLFDDSPEILARFGGIKVVMDRPYNRHVQGHRIFNNDWLQFHSLVTELAE